MNPPFRISAVVPSYNRPDLLRRVLLAFATQTRPVDELIITDDGSHVDIAAGVADVLPELRFPVTLVAQPDEGFRAAKCRNNGIREATGDYLVFDPVSDEGAVWLVKAGTIVKQDKVEGPKVFCWTAIEAEYVDRAETQQPRLVDLADGWRAAEYPLPDGRAVRIRVMAK